MTTYQTRIVPAEHDSHVLPVAEIYLACAFGDCASRFDLPLTTVPQAPVIQPRIAELEDLATDAGWTSHRGRPRCPAHPHGQALGLDELEPAGTAHRREQAITDTAEIDPAALRAALDEGEEND